MASNDAAQVRLYYWPGIPGRGEFVRLLLEDAGIPYVDVARETEEGVGAIGRVLEGEVPGVLPFAPPVVEVDGELVAQTALIGDFLARRFELPPGREVHRRAALQHALTLADFVVEAHDTHHPVGVSLYYEDQKPESARRAEVFRDERMPKFLGYFEKLLAHNDASEGQTLVGEDVCYADLSLFHVLEGLDYAFPNAFAAIQGDYPLLVALRARVASRPHLSAYLASDRRQPFNEYGIFRHYPELDEA